MSAVEVLWQTFAAVGAVLLAISIVWLVFEAVAAFNEWAHGGDEFDRAVRDEQVRRAITAPPTRHR